MKEFWQGMHLSKPEMTSLYKQNIADWDFHLSQKFFSEL